MDGVTALREAAIAGAGMAVLPDWLIRAPMCDGRLEPVLPEWTIPPVDVHVVFPSGRLPIRMRSLIDFVVERLCPLMEQISVP